MHSKNVINCHKETDIASTVLFSKYFLNYTKVKRSIINNLDSTLKLETFNKSATSKDSFKFIERIEKCLGSHTQKDFMIRFKRYVEFPKTSDVLERNYKVKECFNEEFFNNTSRSNDVSHSYQCFQENLESYTLAKLAQEKRLLLFNKLVCKHSFFISPTYCLAKSFLIDY